METLGTILVWAVLGLVIGALAKWIMPGPDGGGMLMTILLGIAGALIGGSIASAIGLGSFRGFSLAGLLIAVLGAVLLLWLWRLISRSRSVG